MTRRREALINTVGTPMGSVDRLSVNGNGGSNGVDGEIHIGAEEGGVRGGDEEGVFEFLFFSA